MIRTGPLALAVMGIVLVSSPLRAQSPPPDNEDSRFSFYRAEDGYLRLDGRTGEVSACARRPAGWLCQAVPEDRSAYEAEITRLQGENATLKRQLLAHGLPLPAGIQPRPNEPPDRKPDRQVDHVISAIGTMWRRLVEMIESVQKDLLQRS
jgi:hypothetical protein